jgi:hypothetical protein
MCHAVCCNRHGNNFAGVLHAGNLAPKVMQNAQKERDGHINVFTLPLVSAMPPVLVAWVEALHCDAFFRSLGGHEIYDASIIVGFTVFYLDCYRFHVLGKSKTF